jgi:hypothetical protein
MNRIFNQWRDRLVRDFERAWNDLMEMDRKAISLRAYMMQPSTWEGLSKEEGWGDFYVFGQNW